SDRVIVLDGAPAAACGPRSAAGGATHAVLVRNGRPRALARLPEHQQTSIVASDLFARPPNQFATVSAKASWTEIGRRLLASDCEAVALTDDGGRFVGVVTQSSLLAALIEQQAAGPDTNESFLRSLVEHAPEIISLFKLDGTFTYVNRTIPGLS